MPVVFLHGNKTEGSPPTWAPNVSDQCVYIYNMFFDLIEAAASHSTLWPMYGQTARRENSTHAQYPWSLFDRAHVTVQYYFEAKGLWMSDTMVGLSSLRHKELSPSKHPCQKTTENHSCGAIWNVHLSLIIPILIAFCKWVAITQQATKSTNKLWIMLYYQGP